MNSETLDLIEETIFNGDIQMAIDMLRTLKTDDPKLLKRKVLIKNCAEYYLHYFIKNNQRIILNFNKPGIYHTFPSKEMKNWFEENIFKLKLVTKSKR